MQIERELKFRLSPAAARNVWRRVQFVAPPRRRQIVGMYYDTPGARLQRAGAGLRLRREGGRWLQTLKAEAGPQAGLAARAEWELPAPGRRLDLGAFPRESIMAATGLDLRRLGRGLKPLFETRFSRRAGLVDLGGGARAELSVDRGRISVARRHEPLLELELELKAGGARRMIRFAERLVLPLGAELEFASKAERGYRLASGEPEAPQRWARPAGAETATPGEAFAGLFGAALRQAGANARGVLTSSDPEFLHQMRVGLRRLRSLLRAFRAIVARKDAKPLARALRQVVPPLGRARDWDVFCLWLAAEAKRAGEEAAELRAVLARARQRRTAARRAAREMVASRKFQRLLLRALRWLTEAPWAGRRASRETPLAELARRALARLHRKTVKHGRGVDWKDVERRHALRVKVKRLRYASGFFAPSFARAATRPYLKRLQGLQEILGELNDVAVARRLLAAVVPHAPAPGHRAGAPLRRALGAREAALIASLEPAWHAFRKRRPFWEEAARARG